VPSHFDNTDPWRGLWDPDHLPEIKAQLEVRIKELELAAAQNALVRIVVESHLRDVATATQALREGLPE
jgi:hypothetical protein